jgi:AcrR family transcriptional regulator
MSTKKEETRVRLLDAARKLLIERGFHGVGLEDIAEAAGVSRQAVYKSHFASKAELLMALARHVQVAEKFEELTRPIAAAQSGLAMLEETIRATLRIEARVHELSMVFCTAALSDAGAAAAWQERIEVKRGVLRAALLRVAADGRLSPAWKLEDAVDMISAMLSVETYQHLVVERGWKLEAHIAKVWALCEGSVLATPVRGASSEKPARRKH